MSINLVGYGVDTLILKVRYSNSVEGRVEFGQNVFPYLCFRYVLPSMQQDVISKMNDALNE